MTDFKVPTHDIETPISKQKIVLKDFITGYDDEAIQGVLMSGREMIPAPTKENPLAKEIVISGEAINEADRERVKRVVVSVDGITENVEGLVYGMRHKDTRFIVAEVTKVTDPLEDTPEKKGKGTQTTRAS